MGGAAHPEVDLEGGQVPLRLPLVAPDQEVHREPADHAVVSQHGADAVRGLGDLDPVVLVGGEAAAEERLAAGAAEDLVVGGDGHHLAAGTDPELRRRRLLLGSVDELLDDPAHARELGEVDLRDLGGEGELEVPHRLLHRRARVLLGVAEEGVALAREAVVQLDHRATDPRPALAQLDERALHVVLGAQVLQPLRHGNSGLAEHLAAARLRAQVDEVRVDAVQRDAEQDGQLPLEGRGVEDAQVGAARIHDAVPDPLQQARPLQDLLGEGPRRGVVRAQEGEARPGVAGRDPGQELEVVLQDHRVDGLGGDVHHPRPGVAQADEQEQQPLLVERRPGQAAQLGLVEGQGRHHHRGVRLLLPVEDRVPHLLQARLQALELGDLVLQRELGGQGRLRVHGSLIRAKGAREAVSVRQPPRRKREGTGPAPCPRAAGRNGPAPPPAAAPAGTGDNGRAPSACSRR